MLFYPAALPLSRQTLTYTAGIIRRHRKQIGSPWRKLGPGQQALLVLAYLRKGETFAELAAGFGVGTATAWRYVTETVALQARLPEGRQPGSCPAARAGRARQRPAQVLAHPAQAPLLPLESRAPGQGDPRPADPGDERMNKLTCIWPGKGGGRHR